MNGLRRMVVLKITREEIIKHTQEVVDKYEEKGKRLRASYDWKYISRFLDVVFGYRLHLDCCGNSTEESKKLVSDYKILSETSYGRVLLFNFDGFECKIKIKDKTNISISYRYYIKRKDTKLFPWKEVFSRKQFLTLAEKGVI